MQLETYLNNIPAARRERFESIRDLILRLYPEAIESMRYKMPTYESGQGWVALANQKSYISLYTCGAMHLAEFKRRHPRIKTGSGCINFRSSDDIPLDALEQVIESAMEYRH